MVELTVGVRLARYEAEKQKSKFHFATNDPVYGLIDNSREEQIERGVRYYFEKREQQEKMQERIVGYLNQKSNAGIESTTLGEEAVPAYVVGV